MKKCKVTMGIDIDKIDLSNISPEDLKVLKEVFGFVKVEKVKKKVNKYTGEQLLDSSYYVDKNYRRNDEN